MYIINIAKTIKKIPINKIKESIFENCYRRIRVSKETSYYSRKRLNKKKIYCCSETN